eukprot:COSAG01_NODE_17291_length_1163_cov_1.079887_1_plen_114_part_00
MAASPAPPEEEGVAVADCSTQYMWTKTLPWLETRRASAWTSKTSTFVEKCVATGVPVGPSLPGAPSSGFHERVPLRLDKDYIAERAFVRDRDLARGVFSLPFTQPQLADGLVR